MIQAHLIFWGREAESVARAIEPDNLPNMSQQIDADRLCLQFSTEKIGTLLSTVDDPSIRRQRAVLGTGGLLLRLAQADPGPSPARVVLNVPLRS